ncbi:ABC transporter permease subunit [Clostridium sp. MCC353]|uniref:ABC transporter permease n=1 Tax=Clostridium sp. MCC353 TaxID=2592646 RepID=UPI001C02993E|nr:ABC transporter permease [Clostridium sp. MCC353]MBT9778107.1 ABC transporter permease subunit [Clostridium sp. MCC353]
MSTKKKKKKEIKIKSGIPPSILFLMITFVLIVGISLLAPVLFPVDLGATNLRARLQAPSFIDPSSTYLFGTDSVGRDLAVRILYATRMTIKIAFTGMVFALVIGTVLGILAGMCGGKVDLFVTFLSDARQSIPNTFIGIFCACFFGGGEGMIILVIALTGWSAYTKLMRSQILQLKEAKYIECSRAMGASGLRIAIEHILPNMASLLIVRATMSLSAYILLESSLSYLGLGIQPPQTSLGVLISEGRDYLTNQWWLAIIPSIVMIFLIMQVSLLGDWVRDKLDPKLKNRS